MESSAEDSARVCRLIDSFVRSRTPHPVDVGRMTFSDCHASSSVTFACGVSLPPGTRSDCVVFDTNQTTRLCGEDAVEHESHSPRAPLLTNECLRADKPRIVMKYKHA